MARHMRERRARDRRNSGSPEQDRDGIDAEVMYPCQVGGPWLWRSVPDDEPYVAIVQAYNDWLAQEYCAVAPQRLIGLGIVPMSNINDAVAETQRCAKLGLPGMLLSAFPSNKGYPTPGDDRFWAAAQELNIPVTVHIQLNREGPRSGRLLQYPREEPRNNEEARDRRTGRASSPIPPGGRATCSARWFWTGCSTGSPT